ncbi:hypothetical protein HC031_07580 [Planosporangium thailandense]|uniref:NACHT domain-containing protein n=1 Tax=Planosporangium thailandense TaxID=765197 RepID=A0ABX0XUV0_9ACTN|nr:serine protease [Planosporangium thailandense]NJC69581.1 hypothetical protein [Planosporangium thailandense]
MVAAPFVATNALDLVRHATVQIRSGTRTGSGFFIGRYIVVTCAHVLSGPSGALDVYVQGQVLRGRILRRLPPTPDRGGDYPFPDLAFIGVEEGVDQPSVEIRSLLLRAGEGLGRPLMAYGFNRDTPDPAAVLDPVALTLVGTSGSYVKAAADGIVRGMSGAPVVDPETGYVCGILKNFRPEQRMAWYIDGLEVLKRQDRYRHELGRHQPDKPRLLRPEPGHPLHGMLVAQRMLAEELPYRVVEGDVPLSTVYVQQRAEAWRAEAERAASVNATVPAEPVVISPYEMLARHRNALIVGGPGGGKSTLLQHLVLESVNWWLRPEPAAKGEEPPFGPAIAIRCPATRLLTGTSWSQAVADAVNAELHGYQHTALTGATFEKPPLPGVEWLILIDGLDEILDRAKREVLIKILATRVAMYGSQARLVVCSRQLMEAEFRRLRASLTTGHGSDRLGEYNLRPFDRPAVTTFAAQWFRLRAPQRPTELATGFLKSIDRSRLMPLVSIPLLCTIAADVYQENPDAPLPVGRGGLYRRFVDGLLYHRRVHLAAYDKLIEQLTPLGRSAKDFGEELFDRRRECLTYLAEQRINHDRQPSLALVREWLRREGLRVPHGVTDDHIREALLSTGLLVLRGDGLEFTHQSMAEYLESERRAENFDEQEWLAGVEQRGADSTSLFTLDRYAEAGNDPMPVVAELATPGTRRDFPRLPQLAAVLQDGAGVSADRAEEVCDLTLRAVHDIEPVSEAALPTINHALRAFLQRAPDSTPLVQLAGARRTPIAKRIEAAKVLVTDGRPDERDGGMRVLAGLAYRDRVRREHRLQALHAIAEVGDAQERGWAVAHLAQAVSTARRYDTRMRAMLTLNAVGGTGAAIFALLRRVVDPHRRVVDRNDAILEADLLDEAADRPEPRVDRYARREPSPDDVWTAAVARVPAGPLDDRWSFVNTAPAALWMAGRYDPQQACAAVSALMHDRTLSWSDRLRIADRLAPGEPPYLGDVAFEVLAGDTLAANGTTRVVHRWRSVYHTNPPAADALLRGIVQDPRVGVDERCCALNLLLLRGSCPAAVEFVSAAAGDPALPPPVRVEAATALGRDGETRHLAVELLTRLAGDSGIARRWRWSARLALLGTRGEPFTRYLTTGGDLDRFVDDTLYRPVDDAVEGLVDRAADLVARVRERLRT